MSQEQQGLVVKLTQSKEMGPSSPKSEKTSAAADLIAAMKAGDAKAASLALERHYECCKGEYEEDEED